MKMKIKTWPHFKGELPSYQSAGASGFDVRAQLEGKALTLKKGERALVPTGLSFEIPLGYEIQARPRSGWAAKHGLSLMNTPGTIDADYRGEVKVILVNLGQEDVVIQDQDRCAQLVVCPIYQAQFELVSDLSDTERGAGGFGSTGKA
ncbi:dUTP diphosphatase [bacterium]|nr:dUTP diphosphatase [bacterium]